MNLRKHYPDMDLLFENLEKLFDAPNGIEKARELILQLAIRGKITRQSNSEVVLLKDGIKPLAKDDYPVEIPLNWKFLRLENVSDFSVGKTPPTKESKYWDKTTGNYWVSISDMIADGYVTETKKRVTNEAVSTIFRKEPSAVGTLIMSFKLTIGKVSILKVPAYHNEAIISIYPNDLVEKEYLFKILPIIVDYGENKNALKGDTLNSKSLKKLPIPIPPLNEQKRIVEKVNNLMSLLDELEEKRERRNQKRIKLNNASLEKLLTSKDDKELKTNWKRIEENFSTLYSVPENVEKLKQAILQLAVQGKLVKQDPNDEPAFELLKKIKKEKEKLTAEGKIKKQKELPPIKEEEKPFGLPKGWEWVRLGEILYITSGDGLTSDKMIKGDIPVYGGNGVNGYHNQYNVDKVTLVIGRVGFYCGSIHITPPKAWITDNAFITVFPEIYLKMEYVSILLRAFDLKKDESATAQPVISGRKIYPILLSLPPLNEQKRIVEKVNELMSLCNTLEEKLIKKEAEAERLVGAVVNAVATEDKKKIKREEMIKDILVKHKKALTKLS